MERSKGTLMQNLRELNRMRQDAQTYAQRLTDHMTGRNPRVKGMTPAEVDKLALVVYDDMITGKHERK